MSSIPREALNTRASKPGVMGGASSTLSSLAPGISSCGSEVGRRDLVHHIGSGVAQHPLGADVEDLSDTLRVGGDTREVGAVENRALQSAGFKQHFLAPSFEYAVGVAGIFENEGIASFCEHGQAL